MITAQKHFILQHIEKANQNIQDLRALLDSVPPTQCVKTDCGDWCCTKLDSACDNNGHFMSLPLIYSIEFYAIAHYIFNNFSDDEQSRFFYSEQKERKCVFRNNGGCLIYPVRPFSCRVYGREVPDVFWGIEYPKGSAASINCPNCHAKDHEAESDFVARYPKALTDVTGFDEIIILGWYERCELLAANTGWFNQQFASWWQTYSQLL